MFSPGGGIGRHKDLKSLEGDFVPVQVRPWVPKTFDEYLHTQSTKIIFQMGKSFFQKSDIPSFEGNSGNLSVIEFKDLPFDIKRIFYITGVPKGFERGFHAHKETQQFLICLQGSCEVYLELKKNLKLSSLKKF